MKQVNDKKKNLLKLVGARCKRFRLEMGHTQKEVAKECGCHNTNVSAFERGENDSATLLLWYVLHGFDATKGE